MNRVAEKETISLDKADALDLKKWINIKEIALKIKDPKEVKMYKKIGIGITVAVIVAVAMFGGCVEKEEAPSAVPTPTSTPTPSVTPMPTLIPTTTLTAETNNTTNQSTVSIPLEKPPFID